MFPGIFSRLCRQPGKTVFGAQRHCRDVTEGLLEINKNASSFWTLHGFFKVFKLTFQDSYSNANMISGVSITKFFPIFIFAGVLSGFLTVGFMKLVCR